MDEQQFGTHLRHLTSIDVNLHKTRVGMRVVTILSTLAVLSALGASMLPSRKPRFEYKHETVQASGFDGELSTLGAAGWELVSATHADAGWDCVLKRRK